VTINTDNRLITDTTVSQELYLVHKELGVPFSDIKSMIVAGFKSSFQPFHEKQHLLRRVTSELDRYDEAGIYRDLMPSSSSSVGRLRGSAELTADAE